MNPLLAQDATSIHRFPATYFLVLTVRPDRTAEMVDTAVQTDAAEPAAPPADPHPPPAQEDRALIYAALLGAKSEARKAIERLLAQVRNDHASLPHTLFHRVHSDRGGEFINEELDAYCLEHAIHRTNANAIHAIHGTTLTPMPQRKWGWGPSSDDLGTC